MAVFQWRIVPGSGEFQVNRRGVPALLESLRARHARENAAATRERIDARCPLLGRVRRRRGEDFRADAGAGVAYGPAGPTPGRAP